MPLTPNPQFNGQSPVAHGALDHAELAGMGLEPGSVVDFSASINPYGPAPEVLEAFRRTDVSRYPDRECRELKLALADRLGVDAACIAFGNGSAELIDHLARCHLSAGDTVLIVGPTFGEYERASRLCGARVVYFNRELTPEGAVLDVEGLGRAVAREGPRIVWLCNPNNPTGDYLRRGAVESLLEALDNKGLLVVDEAYLDLMLEGGPGDLTEFLALGNVALLRSMTKSHALAGLRLGYVLAHPGTVRALGVARPPWNVSAPAQAAGMAALSAPAAGHLSRSRARMARDVLYLRREFSRLGLRALPGVTTFVLVDVGDGARVRSALLKRGLQVRDCSSFGLPEYVRISVRRTEECRSLVSALERLLERARG